MRTVAILAALSTLAVLGRTARADEPPKTPAPDPNAPIDVGGPDPAAPVDVGAAAPEPSEGKPADPLDVKVSGTKPRPSRGAGDYRVEKGHAGTDVPHATASSFLTMAPGFFLTNEGGVGHADRIYLRGFDAREGQDIELSVNGMPINESGNFHGNGYADTGFVLPELVHAVRVLEGPFDPAQGNYAVAGSVDYELGLDQRGVTSKFSYGSFNSARLLVLWGPASMSDGTFAGSELYTTDGFGQNRDGKRASGIAQYEGAIGDKGSYRILATAYGVRYHSAGPMRQDDVDAGRFGFYDTYDTRQGGTASRFSLSGDVKGKASDLDLTQSFFVSRTTLGLAENLTGFLLDTQEAEQEPHGQRGDLFDLENDAIMYGARGSGRWSKKVFGQKQEIELGYFARGDHVDSLRERLLAGTDVPYVKDADLSSDLGDLGLYADLQLRPWKWLTLRGGLRGDVFLFDVRDHCAVQSVSQPNPKDPPGDASCLDQSRFGEHREPDQRATTASLKFMPRGTLVLGPFDGFSFTASAGLGVRSIDPSYITANIDTPFASVTAGEGGVSYLKTWPSLSVEAKSIFFGTHVDKDQIFSETEGRNVIGGGTTRAGWVGSARVTGDFFDTVDSVTLVKSSFDDTGLLVPYVPDVVARSDSALFHDLPWIPEVLGSRFKGTVGVGVTVIGERALPYGQRSDAIVTVDLSTSLAWKWFTLGLEVQNLIDTEYKSAEYDYVSDFRSQPAPTLVPSPHFIAGAPRTFVFSIAGNVGGTGT
ncbi:MAG: TonB-dependent receptor plug domain-containing protein [Polyangiaceae bacterium]